MSPSIGAGGAVGNGGVGSAARCAPIRVITRY